MCRTGALARFACSIDKGSRARAPALHEQKRLATCRQFFPSAEAGGAKRVKRDWKRENSDTVKSVRLSHSGSVDHGDRGNGEAYWGSPGGADSVAYDEEQILRAAISARGQEIAGAI